MKSSPLLYPLSMHKQRTHLHRLQNGRTIQYAEYGDPKGIPMFYLHCFMGSCHQAVLAHEEAGRQGFRIIAPNRPGIGASSQADFRTMADYAQDIRDLADGLGIKEFGVLGASSGGCFALAVGHELPERVKLVGVAGCIGPMDIVANIRQMPHFRQMLLKTCYIYPRIAWLFIAAFFQFCKYFPTLSYRWIIRTSSVLDAETAAQPDIGRMLWWDHQTVLLHTSAVQGLLMETRLCFNWGFDPGAMSKDTRVLLWHGTDDPILPWSAIRRMSKSMPNSEAILCDGGHLTFLMHRADTMFERLKEEWLLVSDRLAHEHPLSSLHALRDWLRSPFRRIST